MKKALILLGLLTTMFVGSQAFAACPCKAIEPCCPKAISACPCEKVEPCCPVAEPCPACPVADPCNCDPCCDSCNNSCREKCHWWKFWQNKNCCEKCNKCNKCDDCCD